MGGGGLPHSIDTLCHMWHDDSWIHKSNILIHFTITWSTDLLNQSIRFFLLALKLVQLIFKSAAHYTNTVSTTCTLWPLTVMSVHPQMSPYLLPLPFKFFSWPCRLVIEHLTDTVDSTNLGNTVRGHVVLKLYFKRLQTVSIIFFMYIIFWS